MTSNIVVLILYNAYTNIEFITCKHDILLTFFEMSLKNTIYLETPDIVVIQTTRVIWKVAPCSL